MSGKIEWSSYVGKTVSILICGKDDKTENYMGIIENVSSDDFMTLDPNNPSFTIEKIIFKTDLIKSVWFYQQKKETFPPHPL